MSQKHFSNKNRQRRYEYMIYVKMRNTDMTKKINDEKTCNKSERLTH